MSLKRCGLSSEWQAYDRRGYGLQEQSQVQCWGHESLDLCQASLMHQCHWRSPARQQRLKKKLLTRQWC